MITVAIPCYNLKDSIARCLESVIAQDYADFEILVIDDHSEDGSVEIVRDLLGRHSERPSRHIINEKNLGLNIVRNIAIREAKGDCLFFIDGDDTIEPGTLTLFHGIMEETGAEVVCGSLRKIDLEGKTILIKKCPVCSYVGDFAISTYIEKQQTARSGIFPYSVWNKLYRLEFLRQHQIRCSESHRYHEDNYFILQVAIHAKSVAFTDVITYNYIQAPMSICNHKADREKCNSIYAVMESVFGIYADLKVTLSEKPIPSGIMYLLNMLWLTGGMLRIFYTSELGKEEKKDFLRWLKERYRQNGLDWHNVIGIYNKLSYALLMSPFPYTLFHYYFKHLRTIVRLVNCSYHRL